RAYSRLSGKSPSLAFMPSERAHRWRVAKTLLSNGKADGLPLRSSGFSKYRTGNFFWFSRCWSSAVTSKSLGETGRSMRTKSWGSRSCRSSRKTRRSILYPDSLSKLRNISRSPSTRLRTNGVRVQVRGDFPFILRLSKHSEPSFHEYAIPLRRKPRVRAMERQVLNAIFHYSITLLLRFSKPATCASALCVYTLAIFFLYQ